MKIADLPDVQRKIMDTLLLEFLRPIPALKDLSDAELVEAGRSLVEEQYIAIVHVGRNRFEIEVTEKGRSELGPWGNA